MFKYSKDGVSVLTILDTRRAKINGLFPVKVQVVFRRKQKYYSTGKELSKEDWDRLLKAKSQLLMEVRTDIESSFSIIKQQVSELIQKGEFSFEILSIRLGRRKKSICVQLSN
jgi:integrase